MSELHLTIRYVAWCLMFVAVVGIAAYTFTLASQGLSPKGEGAAGVSVTTPVFPQQPINLTVHVNALSPVQVVPGNVSVTTGGKCVRINDTYRCFT